MSRRRTVAFCTLLLAGSASIASAQPGFGPPGGPRGRGGPGGPDGAEGFGRGGRGFEDRGGDMMRMLPIMAALDADGNGEISTEEIKKAAKSLKSLDKNEDGKLTMEELRPEFGGPGGPGTGRGGPGGPGGDRGPGPDGARGREGDDMVSRLMALDKNQDGKLAKDEVEGRLQGVFARADADGDGFVTKEEIEKLAATSDAGEQRGGRGGFGGPGQRGPGEGGPEGRGFGGPGPGEGGRGEGGRGEGGPGGRGFGGPGGNPEEFINRAFEFDADNDGKLSREELTKMLEAAPQRGGRDAGGRGDRPQRPTGE